MTAPSPRQQDATDLRPWLGPWPVRGPFSLCGSDRKKRRRSLNTHLWNWLRQDDATTAPEAGYEPTHHHALPQGRALEQARAALWSQAKAPTNAVRARRAMTQGLENASGEHPGTAPACNARRPRQSELAFWEWTGRWQAFCIQQARTYIGLKDLNQLRGQSTQTLGGITVSSMRAAHSAGFIAGINTPSEPLRDAGAEGYDPSRALLRTLQSSGKGYLPSMGRGSGNIHQIGSSDVLPGLTWLGAWNEPLIRSENIVYYENRTEEPDAQLLAQAGHAFAALKKRTWPEDHPVWGLLNHLYALQERLTPTLSPLSCAPHFYSRLGTHFSHADAERLMKSLGSRTLSDSFDIFIARETGRAVLQMQAAYSLRMISEKDPIVRPGQRTSARERRTAYERRNWESLAEASSKVPGIVGTEIPEHLRPE